MIQHKNYVEGLGILIGLGRGEYEATEAVFPSYTRPSGQLIILKQNLIQQRFSALFEILSNFLKFSVIINQHV